MGTVYLATRDDDQYQKEVAIKLVPAVLDRDELMRRFRAERQIMASLEHPNIARLLDGDTTQDGVPYVVMEYVQGQPVDRYCTDKDLGIDDKLRLFLKICNAISHAHRNLVVHRDIKPGNILVTDDGEPKLLDFGIAKILDTGHEPALTRSGMRLMTPEYASPEQARGEQVNTSSDVYSLGILLNKLLTGALPYELDTREIGGIEKIICEQPPVRPGAVNPDVDGELDDIVAMAIRKEPNRRYDTVAAFAGDIERYLSDEPIAARPDSLGYRASKFYRRNRAPVLALAVSIVALVAVVSFYTVQLATERDIANAEADKARRVSELLSNVMQASGPEVALGEAITVTSLLAHGAERARGELADEPELLAELLAVIADTYQSLDMFAESYSTASEALTLRRMALGPDDPRVADSLFDVGYANIYRGKMEEAEQAFAKALAIYESNYGSQPHVGKAATLRELSYVYFMMGRNEEGVTAINRALPEMRALFPDGSEELAATMNVQAFSAMRGDDLQGAIDIAREMVVMRRKVHGDIHPRLASSVQNLAFFYSQYGDYENTENYLREAIEMRLAMYGENATQLQPSVGLLTDVLNKRGDVGAGFEALNRFIALSRERYADPAKQIATFSIHELRHYFLEKDFNKMLALATEYKGEIDGRTGAWAIERTALARHLVEAHIGLGNADAAERTFQEYEELRRISATDEFHSETLRADILALRGDPEAAIAIYEDVAQATHPGMMENAVTMATDLTKLGYLYEQAGYPDKSREYLERALAMYEVTQVPNSPRLQDVKEALVRLGGD
jgi:serine/threonine-protein kinase